MKTVNDLNEILPVLRTRHGMPITILTDGIGGFMVRHALSAFVLMVGGGMMVRGNVQDDPTKPLRLNAPIAPGSVIDVIACLISLNFSSKMRSNPQLCD